MPANEDYSDDYVAELLKRDAKATSSTASNLGLGSLLAKRFDYTRTPLHEHDTESLS